MFTADDILARIRERPFVPVRIVTSSGQAYDVYHPDLILVGKRQLIVGIPSNDNPAVFDRYNSIAILHITDLQALPTPVPPSGNGEH